MVVGGMVRVVVVVVVVEAKQGEVVVGCSLCVVMGATRKSVYHQKRFHGCIFFDPLPPSIFHGRCLLLTSTSFTMTHWNRLTIKTLHGSCFLLFGKSDAHN